MNSFWYESWNGKQKEAPNQRRRLRGACSTFQQFIKSFTFVSWCSWQTKEDKRTHCMRLLCFHLNILPDEILLVQFNLNFNCSFFYFYAWKRGEKKIMLLVFFLKGCFYTLWLSKRPNRGSCFSFEPHPLITRGTQGGLRACSVEVGAGEEQWDASAAEGPGGTDSQSAVSMALLWKPGSAAHCCSGWNFNASHSPGTQETANPQTKPHQTCRCLIRAWFLIQSVHPTCCPGGGKDEQVQIS